MGAMAEVNTIVDAVKLHVPLAEKLRPPAKASENTVQSQPVNQN